MKIVLQVGVTGRGCPGHAVSSPGVGTLIARESFAAGNRTVHRGDFVDSADPVVTGRESMFAIVPNGGSQPFIRVTLRHSADFANLSGGAPVVDSGTGHKVSAALSLPPSAFGNDSIFDVVVYNDTPDAADVKIGGSLVVQSADGTVWIEQDTSVDQTIAAGASASIDFDTNGGGAGMGLSWDSMAKKVDISNAGVYSAFVTLYALPA